LISLKSPEFSSCLCPSIFSIYVKDAMTQHPPVAYCQCAITDCSLSGPVTGEAGAGIIDVAKEARKRFLGPMHPSFNLVKIMRTILYHVLPPDGYICSRFSENQLACICSTYIPVYCGLIPPTLQGVGSIHYLQYSLTHQKTYSNSHSTVDICIRSCDVRSVSCTHSLSLSLSLSHTHTSFNTVCWLFPVQMAYKYTLTAKMTLILCFSSPQVMKNMWKQVYRDALHFLKRNGLLQYGGPHRMLAVADGGAEEESDSEDDEESESREDRETLDHSSIEEHIFEHLPPRVLTDNRTVGGVWSSVKHTCKASAILLPYTLPLESAPSLSIRLLEWLPDIQEDVGWMKDFYFSFSLSFSYQLELKHSQSVPASFSVARLLPGWVYGGSSTVLDAMLRLDRYQPTQDAMEGLTMRPIRALNTSLLP
uniref:Patatin-like phospholipase domain containing 2 n=1 Tax=Sinocyclocheilus grahami TaxID=75366 RepID=A0A672SE32_SINGR